MKILWRLIAILALSSLGIGMSSAQSAQNQSFEALLMDYINALNTGDYLRAYQMVDNRSDSYEAFAAGYADTVRIVPYFGYSGVAAGSTYVTSILLGYQADGTVETYYGHFQIHSGQLYSPVRNNGGWIISRASFRLLTNSDVLNNTLLETLLGSPWDESLTIAHLPIISVEMNNNQSRALLAYYDLINTGAYQEAHRRWLVNGLGQSRSYVRPYADFVAGYSDTNYVTVYAGAFQTVYTGNYLMGYLPAVLVAQKRDGSFESYSGCYATGLLSDGTIGIVNGSFRLLEEDAANASEIFDALNINCAALNMGV